MKHYKIEDNNQYIEFTNIGIWSNNAILITVFDKFNLNYRECKFRWYDKF